LAFVDYPSRTIRFTTTDDGVAIAFWAIGEGDPVVILNNFGLSHSELEWTVPSIASFYTDLAERYRVIRFDPRGTGLSGEPPGGWGATTPSGGQQGMSASEMGLEISAVAAALDLESFTLMALSVQGPVAIEYAATHPQVTNLILCGSFSAVATSHIAPWLDATKALENVSRGDGPSFSVWERIGPFDETERLVNLAESNNSTIEATAATVASQLEWNAERFLGDISVPTLIVSPRNEEIPILADSRHLAAGIGGSQLCVVEGDLAPYWTDRTATLDAIDGFLKPQATSATPMPDGFRTVVFTDIVESTEYVRQVGDSEGRRVIRGLEQQVSSLADDHGGRVVKNLGDGSLLSFGSNSSAIAFALDLQDARTDGPLRLRIGMAAGEPIQEDGDIHGTVVAHASRIGDLGDAGDVIVSDSVRQLAAGKGFTFEPRGEVSLKGFADPERVWKVTGTRSA
jgi:class 3 adenylate cyclase/alpha-beta hydrolase superfamily lysophospholipase